MIYTVTTIEKINYDDSSLYPTFTNIHCWGYYDDFDEMIYGIREKSKLMYCNKNQYCIVEGFEEGVLPKEVEKYWLAWDGSEYTLMDEDPIGTSNLGNFAMG